MGRISPGNRVREESSIPPYRVRRCDHGKRRTDRPSESAGPVGDATKAEMKKVLAEIQDGTFAKEWMAEYHGGL
ncbi:hypothetical protein, partial [Streptomyces sp. NPDC001809]